MSISQTSSDAPPPAPADSGLTCVPNDKLRLAAAKIEDGKRDAIMLSICMEDNAYFRQRIDLKDQTIVELQAEALSMRNANDISKQETANVQNQNVILMADLKKLSKKLSKQKTFTVLGILSSILVTSGTAWVIYKNL